MNPLFKSLLILSFLSSSLLHAMEVVEVDRNDENFKKLKMAVEIKENKDDAAKYSIEVVIGQRRLEGHKLSHLYLSKPVNYVAGKAGSVVRTFKDCITIKAAIINDEAVFRFDLDKKEFGKSELDFCHHKNRNPLVRYRLVLSSYLE